MSAFRDYKFDTEPRLESDPIEIALMSIGIAAVFITAMFLIYILLVCLMAA